MEIGALVCPFGGMIEVGWLYVEGNGRGKVGLVLVRAFFLVFSERNSRPRTLCITGVGFGEAPTYRKGSPRRMPDTEQLD